jgi:hypothetical protein
MPTCVCACGRKYAVLESSIGKKARCKNCGAVFVVTIPSDGSTNPPIEMGGRGKNTAAVKPRSKTADTHDSTIYEVRPLEAPPDQSHEVVVPSGVSASPSLTASPGGFAQNLLWALLFPTKPGNLVSFGLACVLLSLHYVLADVIDWFASQTVRPRIPLILFVVQLGLLGLYYAFLIGCMLASSEGEEDLAELSWGDGFWDDAIYPLCLWLGSWVVVLSPAFLYLCYSLTRGEISSVEGFEMITNGLVGMLGSASTEAFPIRILGWAGVFWWPLILLCVAKGAKEVLYRVDLLFLTLVKTVIPYLVTVGVVVGAALAALVIQYLLALRFLNNPAGAGPTLGALLAWDPAAAAVAVYFDIVAMQAIGLYYHHFKHRFAWEWE